MVSPTASAQKGTPWVRPPWDGRLVAALGACFLGAYIFVFARLLGGPTPSAVLGANVIAAIQVFVCVLVCVAGWARRARRNGNRWIAADAAKGE